MKVVVTFDLEGADPSDYDTAYEMLERVGLSPFSPRKGLSLPSTTVMGELQYAGTAATLRDFIWQKFKSAGLKPKALFGGVLEDWAVTGT